MIIGMQEGAKRDRVRDQRIAKVVELAPPEKLLEELPLGEEREQAVVQSAARKSVDVLARQGRAAAGRGRPLQRPRPEGGAGLRAPARGYGEGAERPSCWS